MALSRKKPAPFRRPSIDLDRSEKRVWAHVHANKVSVGDTVASFGSVASVEHLDDNRLKFANVMNEVGYFFNHEFVHAFTVKDDNSSVGEV